LLLFFLILQTFVGFSMESVVREKADKAYREDLDRAKNTADKKGASLEHGSRLLFLHRAMPFKATFWLNVIAFLFAGLVFWIDVRRTAPIPKFEFRW
jgi:hypothetical protein